jgi:2-polyprenyl-3-methyl-5-hydroxy-6-metoxy-1,4-benzoquinol methylase
MTRKNEMSGAVCGDTFEWQQTAAPLSTAANNTAMQRLARVLAFQCRGRTLILGNSGQEVLDALEKRKGVSACQGLRQRSAARITGRSEISMTDNSHSHTSGQTGEYATVLVMGVLEHSDDQKLNQCLQTAWDQLDASGRLVICVPNNDCIEVPEQLQQFDKKRLRRLLKVFGRPKLVTSQPYKWLIMYVDVQAGISRSTAERYRVIADLCRGSVIELGCGSGVLADAIASRGLRVVGVDMNQPKINQASLRYPNVTFIRSDILELNLVDQRFDTVVLAEVLEHLQEDIGWQVLEKAWSLVSDRGRFVISVPNQDCVPHPNHLCEFDARSLRKLLTPFGRAEIISEQPYKYLLMYLDRSSCPG